MRSYSLVYRYFTLATSIVALATAVPQPADQRSRTGGSIPITKRSNLVNANKSVNINALKSHVTSVKAKILRGFDNYEKNTGMPHPSAVERKQVARRDAGDVMTDLNDPLWYGTVSVGTPPTSFIVNFDTGVADFFIPSVECDASCNGHTRWDPSSSSTMYDVGEAFSFSYSDAYAVSGEQYTDSASVAGYTATNQTIGAALNYSTGFQSPQFLGDGLMGMGFLPLSNMGAPPFFDTLVREFQVTDPAFSFKLSNPGGELYLGGSDPALYTGDFAYVSVTNAAYWQVNMDDIQGNDQTILNNVDSVIDTGSIVIIGDPSGVSELYNAIGGTAAPSIGEGYYTIPCYSTPSVTFTFGGVWFSIPPSTFNLGPISSGSSDCVGGIISSDGLSFWVIGGVFLQNVYTRFDFGNASVGFARLA